MIVIASNQPLVGWFGSIILLWILIIGFIYVMWRFMR